MNDTESPPFLRTLRWLSLHAGFPASRLVSGAEMLVLVAAAAEAGGEGASSGGRYLIQRRDVAKDAALRAHQARRALVHYKCDNSAKV